jgi:hypothetical protein
MIIYEEKQCRIRGFRLYRSAKNANFPGLRAPQTPQLVSDGPLPTFPLYLIKPVSNIPRSAPEFPNALGIPNTINREQCLH